MERRVMRKEGKEAPGLGLDPVLAKKYRAERLARPSHWNPGVRVQSAEEYDRYTDQLARELLAATTPNQLAVIAAQHMIYADELKCVLEENKAEQVAFIEDAEKAITDGTIEIATKVSMTVLKAYRTHTSNKRANAVAKRKKDVKALARNIATEKWRKDLEQKIKTGEMAKFVFDALKETKYSKLAGSVDAVRRWIKPCAPDYASKPGPSKK